MTKLLACAAFAVGVVASSATFAADKTIILAVKNMHCADCPFIVKKSLEVECAAGAGQFEVSDLTG